MCEAYATSVASNLVPKLNEYLFAPIGRQFGYVLCYKSYVADLKNGVEKLETARERVEHSVQEAENNGKPIENDIKKWLESVENEAKQARNLVNHGESAKHACFRGWLPNPLVRHPIGRKVKKMTQVIQELHEKSRNNNFQKVYYENPPPGNVTATTSAARSVDKKDVMKSRASIIEDVMKALADDKICVIGVHGPGGVGKSKLLEDVEKRVRDVEKLFDVVATANISRNPDLRKIQGEIAYALSLKLMNEETTRGRADLLCKRLESDPKKKILIILDNLWKKLELKEVGIPCGDDNKVRGCKLLLTSRNRDVLRTDMSSDREFQLNMLEHGEARRLFERTLGDRVNDPELEPWVDGVVKNCGGLPLLIVSLAKRLKHGDLAAWRNASTNIDMSDVGSLVELNYNDLKDARIKSLFLFCALNSGRIFVGHSLVCCMGLGLFEKFNKTLENNRDRLIMDIHSLQDSSLLLDSDDMERFRIHDMVEFRMHDIFVDVAIAIASREWNALVGRKNYGFKEWSKDELRKCTAISFPWVGIDELPEKLDCPNLRMLLLYEPNSSLKIPKSFFESMEKLQVMDLTGFSFTSLPSSIEFLENLKSLCLYECHLEDVTVLGKLKELQFLIFHGSSITRLPKEIGGLTELRLLDLTGCTKLKVIEPGVLGSLVNLQELKMEYSFDQWEAKDEAPRSNASLAELKNMKNLSTLSIAIPHPVNHLRDLPFGKLNKHKIQIGEVWDWLGEYKESRTLKLKLDSGDLLLEGWVQKCLQRTQDLHLDGLQDGHDSIHDLCIEGYQELKLLHVQNSPSFQYVVHSKENVQCTAFTRLESFFLENLHNLEKICHGCLALESFGKLKIVKVDDCGEIKHLFPLSMTRNLLQLEEIEISRCHLMQQIFANAESEDRDEIDDDTQMKSCNLRRLTLRNLPEMTSFCTTANHSVDFFDRQQLIQLQGLESITIERCQLIREVFDLEGLIAIGEVEILTQLRELILRDLPSLGRICNKNPRRTLCFRNLTALKVQNCEKLRFLFSASMAKALGQIKEIEIGSCKLMEEIIDVQEEVEEAATANTLEFPLLTSLSLEELPNLRTFSYGKYHIHCASLTRLMISQCPKMMTFSSFDERQQSIKGNTNLRQEFGRFNPGLSLPGFFNEKVLFPSLEELKLSSMCQLKTIWHSQLHEQSFCKLASLTVELCENLSHVFPSNSMDRLQSLNKIEVVGCPSLEALFERVCLSSEKRPKPMVLPTLEKMKLLNLPRLKDILKSDCKVTLAFPSLMEVNARHCHSLPYLFSSATTKTLDKLVVLDVSCCNNLRGIIAMEEGKENTVETLKFRQLSTLKLGDLENLISFRSASCARDRLYPLFDEKLAFQNLEELHIEGAQQEELWNGKILVESFCRLKVLKVKQCHNLRNVIPSFMWNRLLHCMESLTVEKCPRLRNLFTMSMAKSLGQLRYLSLGGCGEMEYIVAREEERPEEAADRIEIPQLVTIYLHNMPKLRSFCQMKHISKWPSLKEFTVEDCNAVEVILGDASFRKPEGSVMAKQPLLLVEKLIKLPNLEAITIDGCQLIREVFDLEELIDSGDVEILCRLTRLTLSGLPSLERIWSKNPRRALCFRNVRTLKVQNCENLGFLFSSSMAKELVQIKEIEITSCILMEEIMYVQEEELEEAATTDTLEFPLLTSLSLVELPNLKTFSYGKYYIYYPSLTRLMISGCPKMMIFSSFEGRQRSITSDTSLQQAFGRINSGLSLPGFFNEKVLFPSLEELKLSSMCQLKTIWHSQLHEQSFCKLASLTVELCENLSHIFPSNSMDRLQSLNKIEVVGCPSLEALFERVCLSSEKRQKPLVLPTLEKMKLLNLPRLKDILKSDCKVTLAFPSLMEVNARHCHSLPYLFSNATAKTLDKLDVLDVSCCNNLRGIIAMDEGKENSVETLKFRQLSTLKLGDLENLISFRSASCACDRLYPLFDEKIAFQNLEELHIEGAQQEELWNGKILVESFCRLKVLKVKQCHNLRNVIPSFMWNRLLHCMESLTVEKCPRLRNLFTMSMAKSLGQLRYLSLGGCGEMEYIVAREEERPEEAADRIEIPQLVNMYLHNMPKLRSFCQGKHISKWPSLKEFTVEDCNAVEVILGDASFRKPYGSVMAKQPLLLVEKIEFPSMESMKILHMDNVEKIWLDELASNAFGKLKTLTVEYCEKLLSIFSSYTILTKFKNLEKLTVTNCGSLKVIFHVQDYKFSECHSTSTFQLRDLVLTRLPKMKHVWNGLPKGGLTFGHLRCVKAVECESLISLFPSLVAKSMTQLEVLLVRSCWVEQIIAEEDEVGTSASDHFFSQLTDLRLLELPELRSFYGKSHTSTWPLLKQLHVEHCGKMRSFSFACEIQSCQGTTACEDPPALFSFEKVVPHLEGLTLMGEDVAKTPPHYIFGNLRELALSCYHDENVAFPSEFLLRRFPNLEELLVTISSFEEIFPEDASRNGGATPCGGLTDLKKPLNALGNLKRLHLHKLCNLKRIWKDGSLMVDILKQIEVLWVLVCPNLSILLPSPTSFQRLTQLVVHDCAGLVHMGTCSAVTSLVHLIGLILRNCDAMEDVVTDDGNGVEEISFPKLRWLMLDCLPSLESFSPSNCAFRFPSLVHIVVTRCPKMNIFCKGALSTPNLDKVLLSSKDDEGCWEGDLNTTIQNLST